MSKFEEKYNEIMNEITQEKDLDPDKPIIAKGVKGMDSKKFTKKFKNMDEYEKWYDKNEGDVEIIQLMNESGGDKKVENKKELKELAMAMAKKRFGDDTDEKKVDGMVDKAIKDNTKDGDVDWKGAVGQITGGFQS